jgi:glycosyltransferase involved in cell wall biosynthesis
VRVLFASPTFAPQLGGAETWTRAVLGALRDRGHDVSVVARAAPAIPHAHDVDGIVVERVAGGRPTFARAIGRAIRTTRPEVVIAQYAALPPAVVAARRQGIPVVGVVHDIYGWRESWRVKGPLVGTVRRLGLETTLRRRPPDLVLVPSEATAARVRALVAGVEVRVVPPGVDHLPPPTELPREDDHVLFVGRLVSQKGVHDLLTAVSALRSERRDVRLTIVGNGPDRDEIQRRAVAMPGAVRLLHDITEAELDRLLSTAAVLALPSTREGWGLAVTEAASRATPYVAYDIPAVREQDQLLGGGLVVPPDVTALTDGLRRLLDDPAAARVRARWAQEITRELTWAAGAAVVETALLGLTSG